MFVTKTPTALKAAAAVCLMVSATPAMAYMGAGAGLSAIGSILSFLGVFLLMVVGFVWYPVKRMIRKMRGGSEEVADAPVAEAQAETDK